MIQIDDKGPSLHDYIEQNQSLLSAMAVLVAIATFVANLPVHWLGSSLLFLSIAAVVTIWVELYMRFPMTGSIRLVLFKNILSLSLMGFILYWFLAFGTFWNIFAFVPLFCLMFYMSITILKQLTMIPIVRKIFGKKGYRNVWQKILIAVYGLSVSFGIMWMLFVSIGASPALNLMLEFLRINFR